MDKHRTRFLASLSARLSQDIAANEDQIEALTNWDRPADQPDGGVLAPSSAPLLTATATSPDDAEARERTRSSESEVPVVVAEPSKRTREPLRTEPAKSERAPAMPWSETGMSQALRDAIASVRRVSRHEMAERPRSPEQAFEEQPPPEDAPADRQSWVDRLVANRLSSLERHRQAGALPLDETATDELPLDGPGTDGQYVPGQNEGYVGRALQEEEPLEDLAPDAWHRADEAPAPHERGPLSSGWAERQRDVNAYRLDDELAFDHDAPTDAPSGGGRSDEVSAIDLNRSAAQPRFDEDLAAPPVFAEHEPVASDWRQETEDRAPLWREATGRRGLHFTAFVLATVFVVVAGFGLGMLSGAQELDRLSAALGWPRATDAGSRADVGSPSAGGVGEPAETVAPPPLSESTTVRLAPPPGSAMTAQFQGRAPNGMPLPSPPKPAPDAPSADIRSQTADQIDSAVDDAAVAVLDAQGAASPLQPIPTRAASSEGRVLVHYTESAPGVPATALHLVRSLESAGFTVEPRPVDFAIPEHTIRYFFEADRDDAEALSARLASQLPGEASLRVLDFTDYQPKPREGHIEVWLGR